MEKYPDYARIVECKRKFDKSFDDDWDTLNEIYPEYYNTDKLWGILNGVPWKLGWNERGWLSYYLPDRYDRGRTLKSEEVTERQREKEEEEEVSLFLMPSNEQLLIDAAKNGDFREADKIIFDGVNIDSQDGEGWTSLMHAVQTQNLNTIDLLVGRNADVDLQNGSGETALMIAATNDNLEIIRIFN